ncbi:MAG: hypothetical protein WCP52_12165 [Bacteroidota bacterium]
MPKPQTFPTLFDQLKTVSISFLKKHGYLKPNQWQSGTITWSRNGNKTASISIWVNIQSENSYLQLDYKFNDTPINYRVQLVSIPSNFGKGVVWFFVCPYTGKRCRKLYLADTYFYHRSAFSGCMYEKQTYSYKNRWLGKQLDKLFGCEIAYEEIYSKHFKKTYNGKPTKRYLKLLKQVKAGEGISEDVESNIVFK